MKEENIKSSMEAMKVEIEDIKYRLNWLEMQQILNQDFIYDEIERTVREYYQDDVDRVMIKLTQEFRKKLKEKFNIK